MRGARTLRSRLRGIMAAMTVNDDLAGVADEYWEAKLAASPLFAAFLGDHRFDDRADDLSAEAEQRLRSTWVGLRARAVAIAGELSDTDRVTRDLVLQELDDEVRGIDLRLRELMSDQLQGVRADLLITAGQLRNPCTPRWRSSGCGNSVGCSTRRPSGIARGLAGGGRQPGSTSSGRLTR